MMKHAGMHFCWFSHKICIMPEVYRAFIRTFSNIFDVVIEFKAKLSKFEKGGAPLFIAALSILFLASSNFDEFFGPRRRAQAKTSFWPNSLKLSHEICAWQRKMSYKSLTVQKW